MSSTRKIFGVIITTGLLSMGATALLAKAGDGFTHNNDNYSNSQYTPSPDLSDGGMSQAQ
jgi:hypothetical protein